MSQIKTFFSADCSWDFFSCTKSLGTWPANKACCTHRFNLCYAEVKPSTSGVLNGAESNSVANDPENNIVDINSGKGTNGEVGFSAERTAQLPIPGINRPNAGQAEQKNSMSKLLF